MFDFASLAAFTPQRYHHHATRPRWCGLSMTAIYLMLFTYTLWPQRRDFQIRISSLTHSLTPTPRNSEREKGVLQEEKLTSRHVPSGQSGLYHGSVSQETRIQSNPPCSTDEPPTNQLDTFVGWDKVSYFETLSPFPAASNETKPQNPPVYQCHFSKSEVFMHKYVGGPWLHIDVSEALHTQLCRQGRNM